MLQRRQVMFEPTLWERIVTVSDEDGISASEFLRRSAAKEVKRRKSPAKKNAAEQMLKTMEKLKKMGMSEAPTDLAVNHDYYLYGWPKEQE